MNKDRYNEVNNIMLEIPESWRHRWCTSICGCLGCVNRSGAIESKGVSKSEWEEWKVDNEEKVEPLQRINMSDFTKIL